jgi:hypothetical protein
MSPLHTSLLAGGNAGKVVIMTMSRGFGLGLVLGVWWLLGAVAYAQECDEFTGDAGDNIILIGEASNWVGDPVTGFWGIDPGDSTRICWEDMNGQWHLWYSYCNHLATDPGEYLTVNGGGGNDIIAVYQGGVFCDEGGGRDFAMSAWNSASDLSLVVAGGGGADQIFGSPNWDEIYSAGLYSYANDFFHDLICGYGGDDVIFGDYSDADTECIFGGSGADVDSCNAQTASSPERDVGDCGPWPGTSDNMSATCPAGVTSCAWCTDEMSMCGSAPPDFSAGAPGA